MYPGNFVNPTKSLLVINKINIPMDVLNIIKSYIYYDINSLNFAKKIAFKKKNINNLIQDNRHFYTTPHRSQWRFGTGCNNIWGGYNCPTCGEYTLIMWKRSTIRNTLPICFCSD
jgi:hypothetical protein